MLILPPGHAREVARPFRLRGRDKWLIGSALTLVATVAVVLIISLLSSGQTSGNGCIHVTVQFVTGGTQLDRCGAEARAICASVGKPGGYQGQIGRAVAGECRRAGIS